MNGSTISALIAAASAIVCAVLVFRSSSRASKIEEKKVDQSAYDQAVSFYEKQLDRITVQFDRVNSQLDKVTTQLASEQDVSNVLRNQVRTLQSQVDGLNLIIVDLKTQLAELRKVTEKESS